MKRVWLWLVILAGAGLILVAAGYLIWGLFGNTWIQDELARIRATGAPATLAEISPPVVTGEENAAPLLHEAIAWLEDNTDGREPAESYKPLGELDLAERETTVAYLRRLKPLFELLDRALARPGCDHGLTAEEVLTTGPTHLFELRRLGKHQLWRAELALAEDPDLAAGHIAGALQIAAWTDEWTLVAFLVARAEQLQAVELLQHLAGRPVAGRAELRARLEPALVRAFDTAALRAALGRERAFGTSTFLMLVDGKSSDLPAGFQSILARPLLLANMRSYLEFMGELIALVDGDVDELGSAVAGLEERIVNLPIHHALTRMLAPALGRVIVTDLTNRARLQLSRLALAALAHRERTGAWPGQLSELEPQFPGGLPLDPLTDRDFVMERVDGDIVLSSLRAGDPPAHEDAEEHRRWLTWRLAGAE